MTERIYKLQFNKASGRLYNKEIRRVIEIKDLYRKHLLMARRIANELSKHYTIPCYIEVNYNCIEIHFRVFIQKFHIESLEECFKEEGKKDSGYWKWYISSYIDKKGFDCRYIDVCHDWEDAFRHDCLEMKTYKMKEL